MTVDVSGHLRVSEFFTPQLYHVMAGPQISVTVGRSRIYVHGLIGMLAATSDVIAQTRLQDQAAPTITVMVVAPVRL